MKKLLRVIAVALSVAVLVPVLGACHKKNEIAYTIGGHKFTSAMYSCVLTLALPVPEAISIRLYNPRIPIRRHLHLHLHLPRRPIIQNINSMLKARSAVRAPFPITTM